MKLIRFTLPDDYTRRLADCLTQHEPDVLQLDMPRNNKQTVGGSSKYAGHWRTYLRDIHTALYLSSSLKVVTNAGGSHVVGFMEELAGFLAEHGSADMPIAAIRGSNVMNFLEEFVLPETLSQDQNVLAAQVEIGAGPIATALAEDARIVVCGDYDRTSPFLAAAASDGFCDWQDICLMGQLAAASQFEGVLVEALKEEMVVLESDATDQLSAVRKLGRLRHADLSCDYTHLDLIPSHHQVILTGMKSQLQSGIWNLRFTFDQVYQAYALISTQGDRRVQMSQFCEQTLPEEKFSLETYFSNEKATLDEHLVKLSYQAATLMESQLLLDEVKSFVEKNTWAKIVQPKPTIEAIQKTEWLPIRRDKLTLAVETRPAREWL